ncbi:MAG TPA: MFS transporter [Thermoleophilaceae bacterium]|nr:MFS transporter [Thermoleophilaceae bacterium]
MYQVESSGAVVQGHRGLFARGRRTRRVSRTVVLLGVVSMLTDISAEMVSAVLPLYLVYTAGFSPLQYGVVDGIYQGASSLVRLASGFAGDRFGRHKDVATVGYGLSAACKLGLLAVGSAFSAIGAIVLLDRTGKGIRTAPRDAMISLSSSPGSMATAFGVHRALDTTGAMLGPLAAFGLLAIAPLAFDSIFLVSFCVAVVGVAVLVLFVDRQAAAGPAPGTPAPAPSLRDAGGMLRVPGFAALLVVGGSLGLVTLSDGFLYLALERQLDFEPAVFPLLFVGTALVYMLLAVPAGRLADRVGRGRVFVAGYALLALVYAVILLPSPGWWALPVALGLLGAYYAATDGVLMALGSTLSPAALRGTALALLGTVTSVARLLASVIFGALWVAVGMEAAILCFGVALLVALALSGVAVVRRREATA